MIKIAVLLFVFVAFVSCAPRHGHGDWHRGGRHDVGCGHGRMHGGMGEGGYGRGWGHGGKYGGLVGGWDHRGGCSMGWGMGYGPEGSGPDGPGADASFNSPFSEALIKEKRKSLEKFAESHCPSSDYKVICDAVNNLLASPIEYNYRMLCQARRTGYCTWHNSSQFCKALGSAMTDAITNFIANYCSNDVITLSPFEERECRQLAYENGQFDGFRGERGDNAEGNVEGETV